MKPKNRFVKGQSVYACRVCKRNTRQTGRDNSSIDLCEDCYELAGIENALSDGHSRMIEVKDEIIERVENIRQKGGDTDVWKDRLMYLLEELRSS